MKTTFSFALLIVLTVAATASAGSIISVNFYEPGQTGNALGGTDVAGHLPVDNWNNFTSINDSSPKTVSGLVDDQGNATGASVSVDAQAAWQVGLGTIDTANKALENGYWDTGSGDGAISFTGLPTAGSRYRVIVYLHGTDAMGNNTPAEFGASVGSEEYWLRWLKNAPDGTYSQSLFTNEADAQSSSNDDNMLIFDNGGSYYTSSDFVLNIFKDPDSTATWARAAVSGIQIDIVPEPSTYALGIVAILAVGFVAWRKRRAA